MELQMDLQGKTVVVTGGAKRVGRAIVQRFAEEGARIRIHCRNSIREAEELLESIGGRTAGHDIAVFDLADPCQLEEKAPELLRGASVLVNNASVFVRRTIPEESPADALNQWNVNCMVPIRLMQIFASVNSGGVIINMLDQGICRPDEFSFSYALSKKALADATRSAALQLAPRIRVNGIAPGPVLPPVEMPASRMEKTLRRIPLKRPVKLDDLCSGVVFLAQNESMTGSILFMDCGQSLCQDPRDPV